MHNISAMNYFLISFKINKINTKVEIEWLKEKD